IVLAADLEGGAAAGPWPAAADAVDDAAFARDQGGGRRRLDPRPGDVPLQLAVGRVHAPDPIGHRPQDLVLALVVLEDRRRAVIAPQRAGVLFPHLLAGLPVQTVEGATLRVGGHDDQVLPDDGAGRRAELRQALGADALFPQLLAVQVVGDDAAGGEE